MSKTSNSSSKRLDQIKEEAIDYSDIAKLDDAFFKNAELKLPAKQAVTIRLDSDVLTWFKSQGKGYQTRINQLLRRYMETHQS